MQLKVEHSYCIGSRRSKHFCILMFSAFSCHEKIPSFAKKATAQTVASNNIIAYGIFRFHEGMSICRFHELSHSHISLLIDMGFTALAIAERVGHESIDITYRYAHLFPTRQVEMADKLDSLKNEKGV